MDTKQIVSMVCGHAKISQAELARRLNTTPSNLNQKIRRETLTHDDWERIAAAVDGRYTEQIVFEDGTVIKL